MLSETLNHCQKTQNGLTDTVPQHLAATVFQSLRLPQGIVDVGSFLLRFDDVKLMPRHLYDLVHIANFIPRCGIFGEHYAFSYSGPAAWNELLHVQHLYRT